MPEQRCRCGHELAQHSTQIDLARDEDGQIESKACNECSCLQFQEEEVAKEEGAGFLIGTGIFAMIGLIVHIWARNRLNLSSFVFIALLAAIFVLAWRCRPTNETFTATQEKKLRAEFLKMHKPRRTTPFNHQGEEDA